MNYSYNKLTLGHANELKLNSFTIDACHACEYFIL